MSLLRVLFAEDEELDCELVRRELDGLATVERAGTREQLALALKQQWDCVLLDLFIPELTGDEAMRIIRETDPIVPVIIVTGSVDDETAAMSCQKGAVDYLRKDRIRRLRMAITNAVENAKTTRENEERKAREMRNQRLEMLGELVGGLSHDLRNVLSIILAGVEIIRPKIGGDEQRILDVMTSSVRRAEQMLQQLLAFGRGNSGELHKVSTEHVVGEIETLIRAGTMPNNIRVQIKTAIGTAEIRADENQLNRALWNLVINAKEAMMPGGGELIIAAQNVQLEEGLYVCITIRDTGMGIPPDMLSRIFEPFWTSKGGKGGTGLGLAMTQQIIAAHGGKIGVTSDTTGTEFQVFLPVAGETKNTVPEFDGHQKLVLYVEDEDFLRAWGKMRLENANYRVLDASNGAAAMDLFIKNLDDVSILVTDLNMPAMQGNKLAAALRELKPDLWLVYISGLDVKATYYPIPSAILEKPFPVIKLLEVLRDVLG